MDQYRNFILTIEQGVAVFKINRPQARNAMTNECWLELSRFMDQVTTDENIKVVILTGEGDKAFIAGADVNNLLTFSGIDNLQINNSRNALLKIENCNKPVIAAVNGYAYGGGFEIALACDIRLAAPNARFSLPETLLGIMPGAGGTQRLAKIVGVGRAKEIIMAGKVLDAQQAYQSGLVMAVVPLTSLLESAKNIADEMMKRGPVALMLAKKCINISSYTDTNTGILFEGLGFSVLMDSQDKKEGITAFLEKRPPDFRGV